MDLVTVTCDRDLHQQVLQSHSLDKFLEGVCTHWIIVENTQHPMSYWHTMLSKHYTRHNLQLLDGAVDFIPRYLTGYARQQIIKLAISQIITSDYYLILDSKDVLLRSTTLDRWGDIEGSGVLFVPHSYTNSLTTIMSDALANHLPFANKIEQELSLKTPEWFWAPITPFRCNTRISKKILDEVDINLLFDVNKTGVEQISEFILYRYFSNCKIDTFKKGWIKKSNTHFLWTSKSLNVDFDIMSNDFYKSVSFHRWYIVNNGTRISEIIKFLISEIGLDPEYVNRAFDIEYWDRITRKERGWPIFEQSNFGFRNP